MQHASLGRTLAELQRISAALANHREPTARELAGMVWRLHSSLPAAAGASGGGRGAERAGGATLPRPDQALPPPGLSNTLPTSKILPKRQFARPSMSTQYNADAIEVLNGLEPVRRRPGMYTDTTRPNHLGQEVIDNSVDEALAGHARTLEVTLYEDQSLEVIDDGRGMPVDIHPEEGCAGGADPLQAARGRQVLQQELPVLRRSARVGISVVNALSERVEVTVRRDGQVTTSPSRRARRYRS